MELLKYNLTCPICGGVITDEEARKNGGVCSGCFPGTPFESFEKKYREIRDLFRRLVGEPWEIQKFWLRHLSADLSFSLPSPPGTGKTTFGAVASFYFYTKGLKTLAIFPTSVIIRQFSDRLYSFARKWNAEAGGIPFRLLCYLSDRTNKAKKENFWKSLEKGDFDVVAITTAFFQKNRDRFKEIFARIPYKFAFIDDVDAILKSSKALTTIVETSSEDTVVVVSSATAVPRGRNPRVLLERYGFYPSGSLIPERNILDVKLIRRFSTPGEAARVFCEIKEKLGTGAIIFFERGTSDEFIKEFSSLTGTTFYRKPSDVEKFLSGETDFLVHRASIYGSLVRGLDAPLRVRYVVFFGVPSFRVDLSSISSPGMLLQFFQVVERLTKYDENFAQLRIRISDFLNRYSRVLSIFRGEISEDVLKRAMDILREITANDSLINTLSTRRGLALYRKPTGETVLLFPDSATYIQASGRASRFYGAGVTFGVSVVVDERASLIDALEKSLRLRYDVKSYRGDGDGIFVDFEKVDFKEVGDLIESTRSGYSSLENLSGISKKGPETALLVVESPTKARTISGFFGKPGYRRIGNVVLFQGWASGYSLYVAASKGHVYDLTTLIEDPVENLLSERECYGVEIKRCADSQKKDQDSGASPRCFVGKMDFILRIESNGYTKQLAQPPESLILGEDGSLEKLKVVSSQRETVNALRLAAWLSGRVFLTTDPDTEGERISYDLETDFSFLPPERIKRLEMHAITPSELFKALDNPREVDVNLVKSQLARRYEDRWIGFSLSQKLQEAFKLQNLSAGRVQTPVLGWIIERTEKSRRKQKFLEVDLSGLPLRFGPFKEFTSRIRKARVVLRITDRSLEEKNILPPPPLTTSVMIEEASRIFKFSSGKTMQIAQDLFSVGLITYHRTDSTHISDAGFRVARNYAEAIGAEEELAFRSWGEEGTHEAIRPTRPLDPEDLTLALKRRTMIFPADITPDHIKLYSLIFHRFMASQWREAKVKTISLTVSLCSIDPDLLSSDGVVSGNSGFTQTVSAVVEVLERGFLRWKYSGKGLRFLKEPVSDLERFPSELELEARVRSFPEAVPFTEGELVNEMKKRGIGRPSTYASIIQKIKMRKFAISVGRAGYLISTPLGKQVYEFLMARYPGMVNEERTRKVEEIMDGVASGKVDLQSYLNDVFENEILKIWKA